MCLDICIRNIDTYACELEYGVSGALSDSDTVFLSGTKPVRLDDYQLYELLCYL